MLFDVLFSVLFVCIFGRLIFFAFRLAWGFTKVLFTLILLPLVLVGILLAGLTWLALPILIIVGIVSLIKVR